MAAKFNESAKLLAAALLLLSLEVQAKNSTSFPSSVLFSRAWKSSANSTGLTPSNAEVDGCNCPPGQFCKDGFCECGAEDSYPYFFKCKKSQSLILEEHCATYDSRHHIIQTGSCAYNFVQLIQKKNHNFRYTALPKNVSNLNAIICEKPFNRTGVLCGKCLPGHYPLVYSFNMTCIPCPHAHFNWLWYIMAAYLPLTLFYLLILFFKINTTSSHFFAVVYYCQNVSMPTRAYFTATNANNKYHIIAQVLIAVYGIWNLDFCRSWYSNLCLGTGELLTLSLDYGIAVYPLFLMLVSYILIELHDRNYRFITALWSPFQKIFSLIRRNWDIRTSVIDAYATFFYLSTTKLLSVSFSLLAPVRVYNLDDSNHSSYTWHLYYAADIQYFGREHFPYAILAVAVMILGFTFPVTTLALYPFVCFQKFLALFPFRWFMLRTFMDSFHGCYKDGMEPGTRDYRWFVAVFIFLRFNLFLIYFLTNNNTFLSLATITLILYTTLLASLQPFKSSVHYYNATNIIFMLFLSLFVVTISAIDNGDGYKFSYGFYVLVFVLGSFPFLYAVVLFLYWIYSNRRFGLSIMQWLRAKRRGYSHFDDSLPDRIENSADYPRENLANFTT